jgi:hypothetical protein
MKTFFHHLLISGPLLFFSACSNEVDLLADYQENASVYGLLDPSQPVQFIKINKVFTNQGTRAGDVARISDSLYFDSLAPMLVEIDNGSVRQTIPLFKANILLKDSGIFASSPNYLYVTNVPLSTQFTYRLDLWLPKTGKYVSAATNMVNMSVLKFFQPVSVTKRIFFIPSGQGERFNLIFQTGLNGKIYDIFFNFNYVEINRADTNIRFAKTLRWKILASYRATTDNGNEVVSLRVPGIQFYQMLLDKIPRDTNIIRRFMPCSMEMTGGNKELDTYIDALTPSIGIAQKLEDYTNIRGGMGVFASRNTMVIDQVELSPVNKSLLVNDTIYKHLAFK